MPLEQTAGLNGGSTRTGKPALETALVLLVIILYLPVLISLAGQWLDDPNYRHGILIPFVSGLLLWKKRSELREAPVGRSDILGPAVIAAAAALLIIGTAASELFTARFSLPLLIIGIVLFIRGRELTRIAVFPLLLLFLMIPLPYIIYYKVTFPMQIMSARMSASILETLGVSVARRGNILMLPGYTLEVIAACSGLRSLMTMVTLALIFCAFSDMPAWKKAVLTACSVPVAIAANTVRLVVTALGAYTVGPEFADGTIHEISGLIVFAAGFIMLMICAGILRWIK